MSGRTALHDFPVRSYKHSKSRKKRVFNRFFTIFDDFSDFFDFCYTYNFSLESRGELCDHSFCSEFSALSDGCIRNDVWQILLKVKNEASRIFKKVHGEVIFESFQYTAIDRELRELSKSLFTFDPAIRFHREKSMTKGGL